jgi:PAS domain S-box-containing protein
LYYKIFNALATPIFVKDKYHRFVLVNDAFCRHFGLKREDLLGQSDEKFCLKNEVKVFWEEDQKILTTGKVRENEEYVTTPEGIKFRVSTRKSLLQTSDGEKYVLGITTDITEKTVLLNKLKENKKKYKTIFNLIPDPVAIFSYPSRLGMEVNDSFLTMSNVSRKSIVGKSGTHAFQWVDDRQRDNYFHLLEKNRKVDNYESTFILGDGRILPFLISSRMIRINNKNCVLYTLRDISEVKQAHEAVRQSEALYKTLINSIPNLVLILIDRKVAFANDAIEEILGCAKEEIIGKDLKTFFGDVASHPENDDFNKLLNGISDHLNDIEFRLYDKDGRKRFLLIRTSNIMYNGKDASMCIMSDITERKSQENYILGKIIETEENDRRRFAADMHDDLGPMLSTIKLHLGLLENAKDINKLKEVIGACYDLLDEMITKVHSISNNIMPNLIEKYGIETAVKSLCERLGNHSLFFELNSNLGESRFPREMELHLYRIISELINNSIKHSGCTHATIILHTSPGKLEVIYSDNGKGYIVDDILKKSEGIGLSNILNRVNLIGGNIEFRRENGQVQVSISKIID